MTQGGRGWNERNRQSRAVSPESHACRGPDNLSRHRLSLINSEYANHSAALKAFREVWTWWAGGSVSCSSAPRATYCMKTRSRLARFYFFCFVYLQCHVRSVLVCGWEGERGFMVSLCDPQIEHSHVWSSWNIQSAARRPSGPLDVSLSLPALFTVTARSLCP